MRRFLLLILFVFIASCAKPPIKHEVKDKPSFTSEITDPELKVISEEFFRLSKRNNITFKNRVSIGFNSIDRGNIIGTCSYRPKFREIDLDIDFWKRANWAEKVALVYHELAHCYCQRDHDFDEGTMYPDSSLKAIIQGWMAKQPISLVRPDGYLEDACPKSIMHPTILDDECFKRHYDYYVKEMFVRCEPF